MVFDDLVAKYGRPSSSRSTLLSNRMGARFEGITATWRFDNLEVQFFGIEGSLDDGLLLIGSPSGVRGFHDRIKRATTGERRPL
jgi:hypothetical protein